MEFEIDQEGPRITEPVETPDQSFRLDDRAINEILYKLKRNGLFDILEFGRRVSLETARNLK